MGPLYALGTTTVPRDTLFGIMVIKNHLDAPGMLLVVSWFFIIRRIACQASQSYCATFRLNVRMDTRLPMIDQYVFKE